MVAAKNAKAVFIVVKLSACSVITHPQYPKKKKKKYLSQERLVAQQQAGISPCESFFVVVGLTVKFRHYGL